MEGGADKARKYRGMPGRGGRERRREIKAESNSPDVAAAAATSQLLLRGLLHLHFGLKIAPP